MTIVGVAEPRFDGLGREVDVWLPLAALAAMGQTQSNGVAGRLAPGVDLRTARQELQMLHERFAASTGIQPRTIDVSSTAEMVSSSGFALFGVMTAAVILILVLACSNVGNLQLARGLARRREIATRLSIGASRSRLVRQLLTEGCVLAVGSGAIAIGVAAVLPSLLLRFADEEVPRYLATRLRPDGQVLVFMLLVSTVACLFFALAPAFRATRGVIPLGSLDRGSTKGTKIPLRTGFLATQVAVCTVLLIAAGLLTRAVGHAMTFDPGFLVRGINITSVSLPSQGYTRAQQIAFTNQLLDHLEQDHKGSVALASPTPLQLRLGMSVKLPNERAPRFVMTNAVSPGFFDLLNIPVLNGRAFERRSADEAVVNEHFARTFWGRENPLGRVIQNVERDGSVRRAYTIVGVVRDAYLTRLDEIEPMIFTPATMGSVVSRGGTAVVEQIRATALAINPAARVSTSTITDNMHRRLEESRAGAAIAWGIGLLGLTLAVVGVFGVFAYAVEERRREIGLRMALGAAPVEILHLLVRTSGRAMAIGLAAGLLLSLACGPMLGQYLYGLNPLDPRAYGLVSALLLGAGIAATFVPARRACRVDPAVTLRED
jgi:putative ABC transport system permease protein